MELTLKFEKARTWSLSDSEADVVQTRLSFCEKKSLYGALGSALRRVVKSLTSFSPSRAQTLLPSCQGCLSGQFVSSGGVGVARRAVGASARKRIRSDRRSHKLLLTDHLSCGRCIQLVASLPLLLLKAALGIRGCTLRLHIR